MKCCTLNGGIQPEQKRKFNANENENEHSLNEIYETKMTQKSVFVEMLCQTDGDTDTLHTCTSSIHSHIRSKTTIEVSSISVFTDSISFYMDSLPWKIIWNRKWMVLPFFSGVLFLFASSTSTSFHCALSILSITFTWASWFRTPLFWNNLSWIDSHIPTK